MHCIKIDEFLTYCHEQLGLSENSLRAYRQDLKAFKQYSLIKPTNDLFDADLVIDFHRYLRETKNASSATIRRRIVTLRAYCNWRCEVDDEFQSPFLGLRLDLKIPKRLPRPIDRPTLGRLFRSISAQISTKPYTAIQKNKVEKYYDQTTSLIVKLLTMTGMRIGEVTKLRLVDVSAEGSRIRVNGKGSRERTVYITNQKLLDDFKEHWKERQSQGDSGAYLFINIRGGRLTEAAFRKRLRVISKSLNIEPYLTPHRFRHSAATLLIEEGVDIRIVQRLLGHASIATTEIYTKVSDNSLVAALERADTLSQIGA